MEGRGHESDIKRGSGFEEVEKEEVTDSLSEQNGHKVQKGAWFMGIWDDMVESRWISKEASLD